MGCRGLGFAGGEWGLTTFQQFGSLRWRFVQECPHELAGDLRDDGVTVAAQSSHSGGNPMSQREKAGLSAPRFAVEAGEPDGAGPKLRAIASKPRADWCA